ncbi:hypothetical protein PMAYCL1PPCAC_22774, partial [Pristionchus mayeri]
ILMFLYMFPIVFFTIQTAIEVTQEANSLIKDYLLSMGMSRILYFLHHFIFHFLKSWISVLVNSFIIGVIINSFWICLYLLVLFTLALSSWISVSLLVGSLFKKPGNSVLLMIFLWIGVIVMFWTVNVRRTSFLSVLCAFNPLYFIYLTIEAKRETDFRG